MRVIHTQIMKEPSGMSRHCDSRRSLPRPGSRPTVAFRRRTGLGVDATSEMSDSLSEYPRAFEPNSRNSTSLKSRTRAAFSFWSAADSLGARSLTKTSYRFAPDRSSSACRGRNILRAPQRGQRDPYRPPDHRKLVGFNLQCRLAIWRAGSLSGLPSLFGGLTASRFCLSCLREQSGGSSPSGRCRGRAGLGVVNLDADWACPVSCALRDHLVQQPAGHGHCGIEGDYCYSVPDDRPWCELVYCLRLS